MINAADLPAVRARADGAGPAENGEQSAMTDAGAGLATGSVPGYPAKRLVLENGRYVVAEPTK